MAAGNDSELTHDELWDDSALVESWNEALQEYQVRNTKSRDTQAKTHKPKQKYHSMAARGEKVPEVKVEYQKSKVPSKAEVMLGSRPPPQAQRDIIEDEDYVEEDRGEENGGLPNPATTLPGNFIGPIPPPRASNAAAANNSAPAGVVSALNVPASLAGMPQAMLGAIQDENLKNMMMSWYYAGYHMGLYEGQQKAWAEMQQAQEAAQQSESAG